MVLINMEKYPLEQLTSIKKKRVEDAEKVLAEKKRVLAVEEKKLYTLEQERNEVKKHKDAKLAQLRESLDAGERTDKIQQKRQYLKLVQEDLKQKELKVKTQEKVVEGAKVQVEEARQVMLKKQMELEKMHLHRKEWDKDAKKEFDRKEELQSDEMGSAMHSRKNKKKSE